MAKPKYEEYVLPRLDEIKDWARNGATDEEIWKRLGIGRQSFYTYKNTHAEFSEVLKFNKDYCDAQIENALFEAAKAGNITAQIFWLKNRRAKRWREKVEENDGEKTDGGVHININIADCKGGGDNVGE